MNFFCLSVFSASGLISFFVLITNYLAGLKSLLYTHTPDVKKMPQRKSLYRVDPYILIVWYLAIFLVLFFKWYIVTPAITTATSFSKFVFYFYFILVGSVSLAMSLLSFCPQPKSNASFSYHMYLGGIVLTCFLIMSLVKDLLQFFFVLELCAYCFYLQFLQVSAPANIKRQQKPLLDGILFYFWANFLGSILILISIIFTLYLYNTVCFRELSFFNNSQYAAAGPAIFLFSGILLKAGAGGVQFLKVELYKSLGLDAVINFSFVSLLFYIFSTYLVIVLSGGFFSVPFFFVVLLCVCLGLFFLFSELFVLDNVVSFFGYSTVITLSLLLLLVA